MPRFVEASWSGSASAYISPAVPNDPLLYAEDSKLAFHGHLAEGDSVTYVFAVNFGPFPEFFTLRETFTAGDFGASFLMPQIVHRYVGQRVRVDASLSFTFTKVGSGTSWVQLDDPGATSRSVDPIVAAVPEPGSLIIWFMAIAGVIGPRAYWRRGGCG